LSAGLVENERVDLFDQAVALGVRYELAREENPALRVAPADERLGADQCAVVEPEEWLVEDEQLCALYREGQLASESGR
jgi:hypothetical protein